MKFTLAPSGRSRLWRWMDRTTLPTTLPVSGNPTPSHAILHGYFKTLCHERELHERATFKCLDRATGLYEFRLSSLRLYCFVFGNTLVLLTNGGTKNNPKEQSRDIAKARKIQQETLDRIKAGASIDIITP